MPLADGTSVNFSYTADGDLSGVTPSSRSAHSFAFSADRLLSTYNPPAVPTGSSAVQYTYDASGRRTRVAHPDGQTH